MGQGQVDDDVRMFESSGGSNRFVYVGVYCPLSPTHVWLFGRLMHFICLRFYIETLKCFSERNFKFIGGMIKRNVFLCRELLNLDVVHSNVWTHSIL